MKQLGQYFMFMGTLFVNRETFSTYVRRTVDESVLIGTNSIFIVAIISTFMGAVTAVQSAYNLVSPLIEDYVIATLVRDMTILELAPTVVALVIAGKAGSNIASGLGTMRISEQIDALEVMGINSASYLVLPKIVAAILMYPCLVVLGCFLSIWGGYVAGLASEIITEQEYMYGIRADFKPFMVYFALIKSVTFGFLISSISSFKGYYTRGGALEVGIASTSAVTNSSIAILLADFLLAQLLLG